MPIFYVVPNDFSALHHKLDALEFGDVSERVARDGDQVGVLALVDGSDLILPSQRLGVDCSCGLDGARGTHTSALHQRFKVEGLRAVSVSGPIGSAAQHD